MPEYRIDVRIRQIFEQVGLDQVVAKARSELQRLASDTSLKPQQLQQQAQQVQLAARERIGQLRDEGPDSAGFSSTADFRKAVGLVERDLTILTKQLNQLAAATGAVKAVPGLGGQEAPLQRALKSGGQLLAGQAERDALAAIRAQEARAHQLNVDPETVAAAESRVAGVRQESDVQKVLVADDQYAKAVAELTTLRKTSEAQVQETLAADNQYAAATARASRARDVVATQVARAENQTGNVQAAAQRRLEEERLRVRRGIAVEQGTTPLDNQRKATLNAEQARNRRALSLADEQNRLDTEVVKETAQIAALRARRLREERRAFLAATTGDIGGIANLSAQEDRRKVREREARLGLDQTPTGRREVAREASVNAAEARRAASIERQVAEENSAHAEYISDKARTTVAEQRRSAQLREQVASLRAADPALIASEGRAAARERANADRLAAQTARSTTQSDIRAAVERRIAERELAQALRAHERAEVQAAVNAGRLGGQGTFFQRIQSQIASRREGAGGSVRTPAEFQTLGQFAASKAITTAGFALSGAVLFGAVSGVKQLVSEAESLERVLNQVEAQFESIGQGDQFAGFRKQILGIARDTGAASDEVATVAFQFKGAFGDSNVAIEQTAAAFEIVKVTGLELADVVDNLTASSLTFGVGIDEIGDKALGLQERFGVLAKETINFVSELAPVAEEVGLTFEELAALGATAQQVSGKSGTALAEGFNRILPAIQGSKTEILGLYRTIPALKGSFDSVLQNFAAGQTGPVLIQLIRDYQNLTQAQKNYVVELLGGRREAQALIPVLNNSGRFLRELDGAYNDTGKTQSYFADLQQTVSQRLARLREAFNQLGEALFRAGLADAFGAAADAGQVLVAVLSVIFRGIAALNQVTGGFIGQFVGILAVLKAGQLAYNFLATAIQGATTATAGNAAATQAAALAQLEDATATAASATANSADTAAETANAEATAAKAAAATGAAGAKGAEAAATGTNSATSVAGLYQGPGLLANARTAAGQSALLGSLRNTFTAGPGAFGGAGGLGGLFTGGGAAAVGTLPGLGLLAFGAFQVKKAADEASKGVNAARDAAAERLRNADAETVNQIAAESTDFWTGAFSRLPTFLGGGGANRQQLAAAEANRRNAEPLAQKFQAGLDAGLLDEFLGDRSLQFDDGGGQNLNPGILQDVINKAQEGDFEALQVLRALSEQLSGPLAESIDQAITDLESGVDVSQGPVASALQRFDTVRQRFEAGAATEAEFLLSLKEQIATLNAEVAAGGDNEEAVIALAGLEQQQATLIGERATKAVETQIALNDAAGIGTPDQAIRSRLGLLRSGQLSQQQEQELIPDLLSQMRERFQSEIDNATSAADKMAILRRGFRIPSSVRREAVQGQLLTQLPFQQFADRFEKTLGTDQEGFAEEVAEVLDTTDKTELEAVEAVINRRIRELLEIASHVGQPEAVGAIFEAIAGLRAARARAREVLGGQSVTELGPTGGAGDPEQQRDLAKQIEQQALDERRAEFDVLKARSGGDPLKSAQLDVQIAQLELEFARRHGTRAEQLSAQANLINAQQAVEDAQLSIAQARIDLEKARAAGDPVRLAQLDLQAANLALANADGEAEVLQALAQREAALQAMTEAQNDIARARLELASAQVARDPLRTARIQVQQADLAASQARSSADRLRAEAQRLQANATYRQAILDWYLSISEYFQALADASGDTIASAQRALEQALIKLNDVLTDPAAGGAERTRARADVVRARAAVRDARFQEGLGEIDFLLEMERVTTGQAIQMLQALLQIPKLTEEQVRTIQRRIKQLQDELSQDFQFNLPSDIALPTVYESRRVDQTGSRAIQDNRVVNAQLFINNGMDLAEAEEFLARSFGTVVNGNIPKRY